MEAIRSYSSLSSHITSSSNRSWGAADSSSTHSFGKIPLGFTLRSPSEISYDGLRRSSQLSCSAVCGGPFDAFHHAVARSLSCKTSPQGAKRAVVKAVFERFTERAIKAIMIAQREAKGMGRGEVGTEQLFLGLVAEERSNDGFLRTGVTVERARDAVKSLAEEAGLLNPSGIDKPASEVPFSAGSRRVFEAALDESRKMGHNYIAPEHIAVAILLVEDGGASKVIDRLGLRKDKLHTEAITRLQGDLAKEGRSTAGMADKAIIGTASGFRRPGTRKERGALNDFCIDITARASEGKIDPVIGRDKEVERVVQILARRTKNNPILLGEPGVGKTAIAEGLAMRIVGGSVPEFLHGKRVMSLDMGLLLAGAKERGELETRVTGLVQETIASGNVILLIDEVHTLVGSGSVGRGGQGAGLDIANLLKPALARGELQCIGATTLDEHRKHIEKDKALARRFQPVMVNEPSQEDAVHILMGLKSKYETHHRCRITMEAVDAAVQLSARYIQDRFLPDKAIDLMDEAGSRARINAFHRRKSRQTSVLSKAPSEYWQEIRTVQASQEAAAGGIAAFSSSDTSSSGTLVRTMDVEIAAPLSHPVYINPALDDDYEDGPVIVGPAEIAAVASMWSGVPIEQLTADEQKKLVDLEDILRSRVVGQDHAVKAIARAVRRARVGLTNPNRPIAAMLFCGPTGVGKTELTKALAKHYFGSDDAMVRLDMSEYMERHTISKLIGSPPGYVGFGDGGTLTEAVRRRPFSVVLLDEIEKAHPDVFNLLLQLFEDGRMTDSQGRSVSFKNTLIVMTSNVGSTAIARGGSNRIGFTLETDEPDGGKYTALKELVTDELKNYFRPELLNRIDEIVVFQSLEKSQVRAIVDIMLKETKERLQARGLNLEVTEAMVTMIGEEGYDRVYGARPLRRAVMRLVEDTLSEALLLQEFKEGDTALLDVGPEGSPVVSHLTKPDPCEHGLCLEYLQAPVVAVSD